MHKTDIVLTAVNLILCALVWAEFFTGGYSSGLTYYNVIIARGWVFAAAGSLVYFLFTLQGRKPRVLALLLAVYSVFTTLAALVIVFFGS